ncbi:hypothetical protein GSI_11096 [Ganoderma sinense ZZ0214-1]|uniref:Uncharacterized protein n=1 Tax=Ganoderma sinense ZZ0214-1 TaxID=1077348 RepID=A0A2G8RZ86_9APHY|nr:hypothetical protein GSI_11096 [Ganoderma sinense ZZ0214-1]
MPTARPPTTHCTHHVPYAQLARPSTGAPLHPRAPPPPERPSVARAPHPPRAHPLSTLSSVHLPPNPLPAHWAPYPSHWSPTNCGILTFLALPTASFSGIRILTRDASTPNSKVQGLAYKGAELFQVNEDDEHNSLDAAFVDIIVNTLPTTVSDDVNHRVLQREATTDISAPRASSPPSGSGAKPGPERRSFRDKVIALYTSLFF